MNFYLKVEKENGKFSKQEKVSLVYRNKSWKVGDKNFVFT